MVLGLEQRFADGMNLRFEAYRKDFHDQMPRFENYLDPLAGFSLLSRMAM